LLFLFGDGVVRGSVKRLRKYRRKLELPNPLQVYHTVLKVVRGYSIEGYDVNAPCQEYLDYEFMNFKIHRGLGRVDRAKLTKIYRYALKDLKNLGFIHEKTIGRCYRWMGSFKLCDELFSLMVELIKKCSYVVCVDAVGGRTEFWCHERGSYVRRELHRDLLVMRG